MAKTPFISWNIALNHSQFKLGKITFSLLVYLLRYHCGTEPYFFCSVICWTVTLNTQPWQSRGIYSIQNIISKAKTLFVQAHQQVICRTFYCASPGNLVHLILTIHRIRAHKLAKLDQLSSSVVCFFTCRHYGVKPQKWERKKILEMGFKV